MRKNVEARLRGDGHIVAWGTGNASREFLYVEDAAEAIVLATERYDGPQPVNIGAGREITIRELVAEIARLCAFDGEVRWDASQPDGQPRRMLDVSRARAFFGFEARTGVETGLRSTIEWFLAHEAVIPAPQRRRAPARQRTEAEVVTLALPQRDARPAA